MSKKISVNWLHEIGCPCNKWRKIGKGSLGIGQEPSYLDRRKFTFFIHKKNPKMIQCDITDITW